VLLVTPEAWLHSPIKQAVALGKINYIYADYLGVVVGIAHSEVEPLQISCTVCIIAHPAVKFLVCALSDLIDVATLKHAIKLNLSVAIRVWQQL